MQVMGRSLAYREGVLLSVQQQAARQNGNQPTTRSAPLKIANQPALFAKGGDIERVRITASRVSRS